MEKENNDVNFREEIAKALIAIGRSLEIMQANLFLTRALVDLLSEHDILSIGDVRNYAMKLAHEASVSFETLNVLHKILEEDRSTINSILQ